MSRKQVASDQIDEELLPGQSKTLLQELHLLTREGHLNADARRKLKQVNHLIQFIRPAVADVQTRHSEFVIVDFASGNAYLGFILYDALLKDIPGAKLISVDHRPEFLQRGRERAKKLGFSRMQFVDATIAKATLPQRCHVLTALHACDVATCWALVRGIQSKFDYLFLAPCCQAEVAGLLKDQKAGLKSKFYYPLLSYAHHQREFSSHLTNVMRAWTLKAYGYQVSVTEFTAFEHTAKTELIIGKRINAFDQKSKDELLDLISEFSIKPFLIREMFPEDFAP